MRVIHFAFLALALPAFACAAPGAPIVVSDTVMVNLGAASGRSAMVSLASPAEAAGGYALKTTASTVHRWVANDIVQYDVALKVQDGASFVDLASPVSITVKVKEGQSKAVFANLRQGDYYRAYVTAKGNVGGVTADALVPLNANTETTADFDFTAAQDVAPVVNQTVTIAFDDVAFSGTGGLTFGAPSDGSYAQPSAAPSASATTAP